MMTSPHLSRDIFIDIKREVEASKAIGGLAHFVPDKKFHDAITQISKGRGYDLVRDMIAATYQDNNFLVERQQLEDIIIPGGLKVYIAFILADEEKLLPRLVASGQGQWKDDIIFSLIRHSDVMAHLPDVRRRVLTEKIRLLSAPILKENTFGHFHSSQPLPFLTVAASRDRGQNSTTSMVTVPYEHVEFSSAESSLKALVEQTQESGKCESYYNKPIKRVKLVRKTMYYSKTVEMELKILRGLPKHDSLLRLFCSYGIYEDDPETLKTLHLLFPYYDMTLERLLKSEPLEEWHAIDLISAFHGLVDGLAIFSETKSPSPGSVVPGVGTHNDIKPTNIMVDTEAKKLVLIDFGEATIKSITTSIQDHSSKFRNSYLAPEALLSREPSNGPKRDVWAIGCIFAEIIVCLGSPGSAQEALNSFRNNRKPPKGSYDLFFHFPDQNDHRRLHPHVDFTFTSLLGEPSTSALIKSCIPIARKLLEVDPNERSDAKEAAGLLQELVSQAGNCSMASECRKPFHILESVKKQAGILERRAGEGRNLGSRPTFFSGRAKALWKRSRGYCLSQWAAMPSSSLILFYNDSGDHRSDLAEIMSIVAARILKDAEYQKLEYCAAYSFCDNANGVAGDRSAPIASALLVQLLDQCGDSGRLSEVAEAIESGDTAKIMGVFTDIYNGLPKSKVVIIILDRLGRGSRSRDGEPVVHQTADMVRSLVKLVRHNIANGSSNAPLKLFLSIPFAKWCKKVREGWGIEAVEMVHNVQSNDDRFGFEEIFWQNSPLPWVDEASAKGIAIVPGR
ncbi:kinase-like domain-containing protein [Daldinia grandis]|nr:kinase-like domain-containing protein [Daldinia grandis]